MLMKRLCHQRGTLGAISVARCAISMAHLHLQHGTAISS